MQFVRVGEYLAVSRITGPHHNLLQVRLSSGVQEKPHCERLPPMGRCVHERLDEEELIGRVLEGVSQANERLGTWYSVTHIRYVENDTKPEMVYGFLVLKLIEHMESGGVFQTSESSEGENEP